MPGGGERAVWVLAGELVMLVAPTLVYQYEEGKTNEESRSDHQTL